MSAGENVIIVGKKSVNDYVLAAILLFNEGHDEIVIKGKGANIGKAVDVYNALKDRLSDSLELVSVTIDSEVFGNRIIPYIEIKVRRTL